MPIINTAELQPGLVPHAQQIYNGLDCCVTFEVFEALTVLRNTEPEIYSFERALQAPAMEMMLRGFKIDEYARQQGIRLIKAKIGRLREQLNRIAGAVLDKPAVPCDRHGVPIESAWVVNPRSQPALQKMFYSVMRLPEQWISQKGVRKLSMNREVMEKLEVYFHAKPLVSHILAIREASKQLEVLETEVDPDGRMRTSYNIAGTESGRWSSSSSSTGTGSNLQNIDPDLRNIFESDPGYKLWGIDLEQAESREVGWLHGTLFDDWRYLDACYSGDLHTMTAKLVWPELPWTGNAKADKAIAEQPFYRHFSYRDMAKRGGHGTSYMGTPFTMARHLKVPVKVMEVFQSRFFEAYPAFKKHFRWVAQELQTTNQLTTAFGRTRTFFGRANDDTTLREAIAYCPQGATADRMNLILWRLWKHMGDRIQLLGQVHDAVYLQTREDVDEAAVAKELLSHFHIEMKHPSGHELIVPGECKIGWNWKSYNPETNPNGLKKIGLLPDLRVRQTRLNTVMT